MIWFTPGNGPQSGQDVVAYVVDGLTHAYFGEWKTGGDIEVRVGSGASRAQFDELVSALGIGTAVAAIVGGARRDFSLAGSS